jgi:hypothetical protein
MKPIDFQPIEKEAIPNLHFSNTEMLTDPEAIKLRTERLNRACQLGNAHKGKVLIQFISEEGGYEVNTTVWNCSDDRIVLKQGLHLPVSAIVSVSL